MRTKTPENTFIIVDRVTSKAVAELSDSLSSKINRRRYRRLRPSDYLPTLSETVAPAKLLLTS